MNNSENAGDFILQKLLPTRPSNASSSSSSSYSSLPIDFIDPAIAAVGRSVPLVSTSPRQDHFNVRPLLLQETAATPPPGFQIPDTRIQADGRGFVGNEGVFEWDRSQLTFGSMPFEVDYRDSVRFGASQSGERPRNSAVSRGSARTEGIAGQGSGDHRGFSRKGLLNLNAAGGNVGFMREGLGQLGASGDHQGFSQNVVGILSYGVNNHGFCGEAFAISDSRQESQRFQQKTHGIVGGSREDHRFWRNLGESLRGSEGKEKLSMRRPGKSDSQGVFPQPDEDGTVRRGDLHNGASNSAKGMGDLWGSRNERRGGRPKERSEDGTIKYFHNGEARSIQIMQNPNMGPGYVEFSSEGLDPISWADGQGSQKRENHHLLDMEVSSSLRKAAAESRIHRKPEGKAWNEDKESERLNNGSVGADKIDSIMGSLVVSDNATENYSRRRGDVYDSKGKLHGSVTRFRTRRRDLIYRSDLEMHTPRFLSIFESLIPSEEEKVKQKQLISILETLVTREWPKARLYLYGSCANTFGFPKSDIDVCLSIDESESGKLDILLRLEEILKADKIQDVQALPRARVPIVKLMDPVSGISCDICINNSLAVINTKLLRDYAQIDVRLRQLAFVVKHWAKVRQVNETYRGTLSSYAYVVMCIHFLQVRSPSILPCLQKMTATYVVSVNGIECAYYDKVDELKGFGSQNRETISQLLCAFFNYWAYEHDYANSVISIRTGRFLSKREKDWRRRIGNDRHLICIEDPFETSHDLGRVVDKFSIKVLRAEFERAADILQHDPNPSVKLFEPYSED